MERTSSFGHGGLHGQPSILASQRAGRRIRAILEQRCDQRVTLRDLAEALEMSPFQVLRRFQRDYGLTPHAYQLRRRVEIASKLLREGQPIAEVAAHVGFSDQSHLAKHFKKHFGVTPSAFQGAAISS